METKQAVCNIEKERETRARGTKKHSMPHLIRQHQVAHHTKFYPDRWYFFSPLAANDFVTDTYLC